MHLANAVLEGERMVKGSCEKAIVCSHD
jgi:hypothetical protein